MPKRVYAKKKTPSAKRAKVSLAKRVSLLGNKTSTVFKYIEKVSLNPGVAGVPGTYVFSANGMYDPNITGVGHQPRGFDQLMLLFDHYHISESMIKVTFMAGASTTASLICGIQLQDGPTAESDMIQALEGRNTTYVGLSRNGGGAKSATLKFNSNSFFNRNGGVDSLRGNISSNPNDQAYFVVFAQPTYAVDAQGIDVVVELIFNADLTEPNNLAAS